MPVGVIVVAAGRGERLGGTVPKQLLDIGGRTLLQRSVAAFADHPGVDAMVIVLPEELVVDGPRLAGVREHQARFVAGGPRRQDSVRHGLAALEPGVDVVLVHDAARPFVGRALVDRVIRGTLDAGVVVPAVQARDTVKRVPAGSSAIAETLPRSEIWLAQTPQGFRRQVLSEAVALGEGDATATDEAMLAERLGHPASVVPGDDDNVKITTTEDLAAARRALAPAPRVGTGYDLHRLEAGRTLVIAGVVVAADRGPVAHSDGDVVCHALVDALLGGAVAGDVGQHFPDSDPAWRGAAGLDLLRRAVAIVGETGWRPSSADVTVVLERPRLAPHVPAVRQALAEALGLSPAAVSVKGKTNEGVDEVGRGDAVAAHAVAVLVPGTTP